LWWHQVESEGRNIAVNFWYYCHSEPLPAVTIQLVDAIIELQKDIEPQDTMSSAEYEDPQRDEL